MRREDRDKSEWRESYWAAAVVAGLLVFCAAHFSWSGELGALVGAVLAASLVVVARAAKASAENSGSPIDLSLPLLLWTESPRGRAHLLNDRWTEYTGLPASSFSNLGWAESVHPSDRAESLRIWKEAFAHGVPVEREHRLRRGADGAFRWFRQQAWPEKDAQGKITGWQGSLCDVHELRAARAERDAALQARDDFLAIASHELRTPLTSLRLKAQTLLRSLEKGDPAAHSPERVKDFSAHADKQVSRLSRLIEDMLEVSRLRHGEMEMHPQLTSVRAIAMTTVESLRPQFKAGHCELVFRENKESLDALLVRADPERVEQVVSNVLTNALRYGRSQPVEVELLHDEDFAVVRVSDHGIGISLENQRKIFNRFDRAISANEISGLGLGLFITNQIMTAHGGQVRLRSEPGIGSVFELHFPLYRSYQGRTENSGADEIEAEVQGAQVIPQEKPAAIANSADAEGAIEAAEAVQESA